MIEYICLGVLIITIILIIISLLRAKPVAYVKKTEGQNICLTVEAKRNVDKISIIIGQGAEKTILERKRVRKDQKIDFVFPKPNNAFKIAVEIEKGETKEYEVE